MIALHLPESAEGIIISELKLLLTSIVFTFLLVF